jgi:hypothetical protein
MSVEMKPLSFERLQEVGIRVAKPDEIVRQEPVSRQEWNR